MTDYNVDNYTLNELLEIIGLDLPVTKPEIIDMTNLQIEKNEENPNLVKFFTDAKTRLLNYLDDNVITEITDEGYGLHREYVQRPYNPDDPSVLERVKGVNVITDRNKSVMLQGRYNNPGDIQQGYINKVFRQTDTKMITIDSQFRKIHTFERPQIGATICDISGSEMPTPPYISSDYIIDLPEPLTNVISMYVHSYEIPKTWYIFSNAYGTTSFQVNSTYYTIPEGNYTSADLITALAGLTDATFTGITLNSVTNKVTITVASDTDVLKFYDSSWDLSGCVQNGTYKGGAKEGYNLGWLLGFRANSYTGATSYTSEGCINVNGFRYVYIVLDDFNTNTANSNITRIYDRPEKVANLPSYYTCNPNPPCGSARLGECDISNNYTQAQTFTINQILAQKNQPLIDRHYGDMNSNIIARIPVFATNSASFETLYSENDTSLSDNKRMYYGPVTISRMRIALLDDKAQIIDLNNMDWSFAIIVEQLYQF